MIRHSYTKYNNTSYIDNCGIPIKIQTLQYYQTPRTIICNYPQQTNKITPINYYPN